MHRARWFLLGAVATLAILLGAGLIALHLWINQASGFSAHEPPSAFEALVAGWVRAAAIPAEAKARPNPIPASPEVFAEAREHWADHCASCHANDGSGDALMGRNMYPPAPDMRLPETQHMTDGELFYIIQNGVRLTGMPGWGASGSAHDEEDSWKLVRFIRHLPQLSFEEKKEMEKLNPKGPEDRKEEEEEQRFLGSEQESVGPPWFCRASEKKLISVDSAG
jgi:mono/diheme cytochrome c family protein